MTVLSRRTQDLKPKGSIRGAPSAIKKAQNTRSFNFLVDEIQGLKKKLGQNKPETKVYQNATSASTVSGTISSVNLFAQIAQGLNNDERVGSKIRVKRIEIVVSAPDDTLRTGQSFYLIRPHENDNPIIGDFSGGIYPLYDTTSGWEIWKHHCNLDDNTSVNGANISKSFGHGGMLVTFETGSANPTRNPVFLSHINKDTAGISYYLSYRIWYTDA